MKACTKCEAVKPEDEFSRRGSGALDSHCKACKARATAKWTAANPERARATGDAWRAQNAAACRRQQQEYRAANRGLLAAKEAARKLVVKRALLEGTTRVCERCFTPMPLAKRIDARFCSPLCQKRSEINRATLRRRARLFDVYVEDVDPLTLLTRDELMCGICGEDVDPTNFHVDHVIPLARGGEHSYANTRIAHPRCNRIKGSRMDHELRLVS